MPNYCYFIVLGQIAFLKYFFLFPWQNVSKILEKSLIEKQIWVYTNYVDEILANFDHLLTCINVFYVMNIDKKMDIHSVCVCASGASYSKTQPSDLIG